MAAKPWLVAFGLVAAAAALDANVLHWSSRATSPAAAAPVPEPAGTSHGMSPPVPAGSFNPADLGAHHDHPAVDIPVGTGTPVRAVRGGHVTYAFGDCGLGVIVDDPTGVRWTYCHASARVAAEGSTVGTGDQIAVSGSTGNSSGPHLHLQILAGGQLHCPQDLVRDLNAGRPGPDPATLPISGCTN